MRKIRVATFKMLFLAVADCALKHGTQ